MRCRHLLNPLLSPLPSLLRKTPFPSPRLPRPHPRRGAAARAAPPWTSPTSASPASPPPSPASLKQLYSDVVIHEVARDGAFVRLTPFDLPDERVDAEEEADPDLSHALESFRLLCGDADWDALRGFLLRISEGGDSDVSPIILTADADKAHRSEVHDFFKRNFMFLVTDTVEHSDGVQKCIRVRLKSGPHGRRDVVRRGGIGKAWAVRGLPAGEMTGHYHLGKFLRFHLYKENKDTQEALRVIGKMLGLQPRSFGFQ